MQENSRSENEVTPSETDKTVSEVVEEDSMTTSWTAAEVQKGEIYTVMEIKPFASVHPQKPASTSASPEKKNPPRRYDRIFNVAGITWGIGTDFIFISFFSYWILSSRQEVISRFEESLV